MHKHAKATLGSGNLKEAVSLPSNEDPNEWLAVNSYNFYLYWKKNKVLIYLFLEIFCFFSHFSFHNTAVDFFNQINLLYGSIGEYCTDQSCPTMSAGTKYEYLWADGEKIKKPIACSAPEYMDYLMTWVQSILDDETVFPSRVGKNHLFLFTKHFILGIRILMRFI